MWGNIKPLEHQLGISASVLGAWECLWHQTSPRDLCGKQLLCGKQVLESKLWGFLNSFKHLFACSYSHQPSRQVLRSVLQHRHLLNYLRLQDKYLHNLKLLYLHLARLLQQPRQQPRWDLTAFMPAFSFALHCSVQDMLKWAKPLEIACLGLQ